ncbi:MAG TPA: LeuA family protein [Thermoanaerobaculia bacterium]|nr:LeuA family protein [Thermoanaerobaculia bacterium]
MPAEQDLIYDWNVASGQEMKPARGRVELVDETLRDGLQSPSVRSPSLDDKLRILHLMVDLGIESANVGLPGAGPHAVAQAERLAREVAENRLPLSLNCAARTLAADIQPIIEISQRVGIPIEIACFLGSSPIRQYTEDWDRDRLLALTESAIKLGVDAGLPVMYVTEDTTRAAPEDLRALYSAAVNAGARRVVVADTVGHATPAGAAAVTRFLRGVVDAIDPSVQLDWHGHRDRGLGEINALVAATAGADRLHGTALGIGERAGNAAIDLLLVNLELLGWAHRDLTRLPEYCALVAETTGMTVPETYPVVGRDAFRTATGVHASAIAKAREKGHDRLADLIYSGVPAAMVGRRQVIEVGPMSGKSNVQFWLQDHGLAAETALVEAIFARAKGSNRVLETDEILGICREHGATPAS